MPDSPAAPSAASPAAKIAHELRNPLNAIAAALEVLNRSPADAPRAVRARKVIANQVDLLAAMIARLDAEPPPDDSAAQQHQHPHGKGPMR